VSPRPSTGRKAPPPPQGRDAVRRALLDAAAELFAEHGPARVSVRDVAQAARVNHGLIHRHFGSKDALLQATVDDLAARILEDVGDLATRDGDLHGSDLFERLQSVFAAASEHPLYFRLLARALLDGYAPEDLQSAFPLVEQLVTLVKAAQSQRLVPAGVEPRMAVALMVASGLGWLLFQPYVLSATGQGRLSPRAGRERFDQAARALVAQILRMPDDADRS
jgi:TetR/AcrR family transcriptional regulator, repressor for neighboring sulfatase